jgi:putative membrane-bound dehydrogenase-like protein
MRATPSRRRGLVCRRIALLLVAIACRPAAADPRLLCDGRSLAGWQGDTARWRVEDGAITAEIPAGQTLDRPHLLWWDGTVGDFDLELEYRIGGRPTAAAGIQFRSERLADGAARGYRTDLDAGQALLGRIHDEGGRGLLVEQGVRLAIAPDGRTWSDVFAPPEVVRAAARPDGWNRCRIRATAAHVTVWINDTLAAVLDDRAATAAEFSGRLALRLPAVAGPMKLEFRDIRLVDLGTTAGPARVAPPPAAGRDWSSPVLWHTVANQPAEPAAGAAPPNDVARGVVAGMKVTPGFRCDLIASEPAIHQPVAFAIDPRGRLWVAEAHSYPVKRPAGQGLDRIVILADADGDGGYETRTVFCEGLNLVSGLEVGFGGVFVGAAPELLFIPDRDGDDVPDGPAEVLLDGWGFQDTHETLNSFTWGPDGWLYGCHGVFTTSDVGRPGAPPARRQRIKAGVWRWHPVRREFEIFAHGGSNPWGIDFSAVGDAFMTHCRSFYGGGGTTHVIRNGHFWNQANSGYAPFISREAPAFAPGLKNYLPAAARYDSGEGGAGKKGSDAVYGGHSHVGTMLYLGDNWPPIYRGRILTHNLHGRQLNHQEVFRQGSGYEVFHAGHDILHVPDETYLAVDLQYGPDGSVYAIDWCDLQHCHHPTAEKWDRTNGRLYRIAWAESFRPARVDLVSQTDAQLVALHGHANEWFVRTARRLLQERAAAGRLDRAALGPLRAATAAADPVTALRAIWTLHVTGDLDDALLAAAFAHASDHVRSQAVALATERAGAARLPAAALVAAAVGDPSALVRRSLASALPALADADRWAVAATLAGHAEDAADRFLPKLVWSGLAPLVDADPARALALAAASPQQDLADSIRWYLGRLPAGRDLLATEIATAPPAVAERSLALLDFALSTAGSVARPAEWDAAAARFATGPSAATAERLSAIFGDGPTLARLRAALAAGDADRERRRRALDVLARVGDAEAVPVFVELLGDPEFRGAVLPFVGRSNDPAVATTLVQAFAELGEKQRETTLATLVGKAVFAGPLLDALDAGRMPADALSAVHVRQLRGLKDAAIAARVDARWGEVRESPAAAKETMARLKRTWAATHPWAVDGDRGRAVFARVCGNCHMHGDAGGRLGPNLTGSWSSGSNYFIENLVDPNAVVGPDYQLTVVTTDDGRVLNGIVAEETATSLVLRTVDGVVTLPVDTIDERTTSPVSMMPAGLLESLPEKDFVALIKFLTTKP